MILPRVNLPLMGYSLPMCGAYTDTGTNIDERIQHAVDRSQAMSTELTSNLKPLNIAILTVSDTRGVDQDTSGQFLEDSVIEAGHRLVSRRILPDDIYLIRAIISQWVAEIGRAHV